MESKTVHLETTNCRLSVVSSLYEILKVDLATDSNVIHCVRKKRDQNVFCNILYETQAILMKSGT